MLMKKALDSIRNDHSIKKQHACKETSISKPSTETRNKNIRSKAGVRFKCRLCEFHSNTHADAKVHIKSVHKLDGPFTMIRQEMFVYLKRTNLDDQWRHTVFDIKHPASSEISEPPQ